MLRQIYLYKLFVKYYIKSCFDDSVWTGYNQIWIEAILVI